jgi:Ca2+-binding RTX toxin-like protein
LTATALIGGILSAAPAFSATMNVDVEDVGWINQQSGTATVTGTVTCDTPRSVELYVSMVQQQSGSRLRAARYDTFNCDGKTPWQVVVNPYDDGSFNKGTAGIDVTASSTGQDDAQSSKTIGLKMCTIIGTTGADEIHGTPRKDIICGITGDDDIYGGASNDVIRSYKGQDSAWGGPGNDTILAGMGRDDVYGGIGDDHLDGDENPDYVNGGPGNDDCVGGTGFDHFNTCEHKTQNG